MTSGTDLGDAARETAVDNRTPAEIAAGPVPEGRTPAGAVPEPAHRSLTEGG